MQTIAYSRRPKTLNGHPVVGAAVHPNCMTVMVQRGESDWVVATWWPDLGDTWSWGHYSTSFVNAQVDFHNATKRNEQR